GLAPALRASRIAPMRALKTGGPRSGGRAGVMRPFVVMQVAFGLVVMFVGTLLVLSFAKLSHVDPGFAASNVLLVSMETVERIEPTEPRAKMLEVLERLRHVPGVEAVSSAEYTVLGRSWTNNPRLPGRGRETIETTMA